MPERYLPVAGVTPSQLSNTFGANRSGGRSHKGIDIFAKEGTAVVAVRSGTVVRAGDSGGLGGLRVWVRDDDGRFHYYAHMNSVSVKEGQRVEGGQPLGGVGRTGNAQNTPPHLHYSVNSSSSRETGEINPYDYLKGSALSASQRDPLNVRYAGSITGGLSSDPQEQAAQDFVSSRRLQADSMANIMDAISQAAKRQGGKVLNVEALFGDIFADGEPPEPDDALDEEVA